MGDMTRGTALVRVAAPLRFLLSPRDRHGEVVVGVDGSSTLGHVIESLGVPRTEVGRVHVDGEPVALSVRARDGDTVDVAAVSRPQRIDDARFLLDVHLGTLARRLRLLGIDAAYRNDAADPELVAQAHTEARILLTQDRGLLRRRALTAGAYVCGAGADEQLADVLDRFDPPTAPWTRCPACNGALEPVSRQAVLHLLQPGTRRRYTRFSRCRACGRPYWRGAHAGRLDAIIASAAAPAKPLADPPVGLS
jgi:uncharacterized protein with PIN domain